MAKENILDLSEIASENTDIDGVGILGTNLPRNLDDAQRATAKFISKFLVTKRQAKSSGYTAVRDDVNDLIEFTAAATLATDAAATLGDGWVIRVYASGGDVTINPNSSETVNGETTITLKQGWCGILRVNNGNFIFEYLSLRDDTPMVAFGANTTKSIASGVLTTLDDLDSISDGTLGNSTLSNGVFTVGTGDAGWYTASLAYKPVATGGGYTDTTALIVPSSGVNGVDTSRTASGAPVWIKALWEGPLAEAATLTFQANQVNGSAAARAADTGSRIVVRRVSGTPA